MRGCIRVPLTTWTPYSRPQIRTRWFDSPLHLCTCYAEPTRHHETQGSVRTKPELTHTTKREDITLGRQTSPQRGQGQQHQEGAARTFRSKHSNGAFQNTSVHRSNGAVRPIGISERWREAAKAARIGNPAEVMRQYISSIDNHFAGFRYLNFKHVSAALYGTAQLWLSAQQNPQGSYKMPLVQDELHAFLERMLYKLQCVMPVLDTRGVSNALWSFAQLQINPDTLMPGIVNKLAQRYIRDIQTADGQSHSSALTACTDLKLNPAKGYFLEAILQHLMDAALDQCNAQALSNIVHSLAKLPAAQPSQEVLDCLCGAFLRQLLFPPNGQIPTAAVQPITAQAVANFAWALQELRHVPKPQLASAMRLRMLHLCRAKGQQPNSQEVSNFLHAYAQLRCVIEPHQAKLLVDHLLSHSTATVQALANTAWSLAVLGYLDPRTFGQLLQRIEVLVQTRSMSLSPGNLMQMYQALDRLQPAMNAPSLHHKGWFQILADLQQLGTRPYPINVNNQGLERLSAALSQLRLQFITEVHVRCHWVDAVIQPKSDTVRPVLILVDRGHQCFSNLPARLTGPALFRQQMLAQEGILVHIDAYMLYGPTKLLTDYLRPEMKAAGGGSLAVYRAQP